MSTLKETEIVGKSLSQNALIIQKFKRNFWGVCSMWFIVLCFLAAIFAYALAPDNTQYANQMHLSIHSKSPGFSVKMLQIPAREVKEQHYLSRFFNGYKNGGTELPVSKVFIKNDYLLAFPYSEEAGSVLPKKIALSVFPKSHSTNEFLKTYVSQKYFILGTDKYGRDLLSRLLIGIRISFSIGFVAVLISLIIGISLGALAAYFGGKVDAIVMWLINVTWSIPTLLMVIAITLTLGKGFWQVFIAVGLTMWVEVARVVRGQVLGVKQKQFITAARALGYSDFRILFRHILPNSLSPVIVIAAANFAAAILIESGLSFLGIGAQPPMPSWGAMIKDHYSYIILGKAYLAIIPGLAIMSLVMAFMLIGNALRDAMDIKN